MGEELPKNQLTRSEGQFPWRGIAGLCFSPSVLFLLLSAQEVPSFPPTKLFVRLADNEHFPALPLNHISSVLNNCFLLSTSSILCQATAALFHAA